MNNCNHPALTCQQAGHQAEGDRETQGSSGRRITFSNQNTARYMNAIRTSRVGSLTFNGESNFELDRHAPTNVLGKHAHIFMNHEGSVNVVVVRGDTCKQHEDSTRSPCL